MVWAQQDLPGLRVRLALLAQLGMIPLFPVQPGLLERILLLPAPPDLQAQHPPSQAPPGQRDLRVPLERIPPSPDRLVRLALRGRQVPIQL